MGKHVSSVTPSLSKDGVSGLLEYIWINTPAITIPK